MFVLAEMTDVVRTYPSNFSMKLNDAIADELNRKLGNRVVYNVGLCLLLYDVLKIEDSFIFPGDGSTHTKVSFRFVVFRPFIDEVILGVVKTSNSEGIFVSMDFFDDIFIPGNRLQTNSKFDEREQLWYWEYENEEGKHPLYMELGEKIRFRVIGESFVDTSPTGPKEALAVDGTSTATTPAVTAAPATTTPAPTDPAGNAEENRSPYSLTGSVSEPGLGLLSWWS